MDGTGIDVRVFTREGVKKDKRALAIEEAELAQVRKDLADQQRIFEDDIYDRLRKILLGKTADGGPNKLKKGDRKSGVEGKSVSVRVDLGGRRRMKKKKQTANR